MKNVAEEYVIPILNQPYHPEVILFFAPTHLHLCPEVGNTLYTIHLAQFPNSLVAQTAGTVLSAALAAEPQRLIGRVPVADFDVRSENDALRRIVVQLI